MIPSQSTVITRERPCTCDYPGCAEIRVSGSIYCLTHWMAWHDAQEVKPLIRTMSETEEGVS